VGPRVDLNAVKKRKKSLPSRKSKFGQASSSIGTTLTEPAR